MTTNGKGAPVRVSDELRIRHMYTIGKTRFGKSSFLKNLMIQDLKKGHGLCFVDPAGDDALDLLSRIPKERLQDVIYFDPAREDCPAFNLLQLGFPPSKLTEDVIAIFKMFYASSWGNQMENLMRYSLYTLLRHKEPHTLRDLQRLLRVEEWREMILGEIDDPETLEFWEREFPLIRKGAATPILNKLNKLLAPDSPTLRVFSQPENDLDFFRIIKTKKILILNLASGLLQDEPSALLGGMIVTAILQTVTAIPLEKREVFYLYADEFHNYVTPTFNKILSGAAKFKLYLTMAHQNLGQLSKHENLIGEIFGNVGTSTAFQISAKDAAFLVKEFRGIRYIFRDPETKKEFEWKEVLSMEKDFFKNEIAKGEAWLASIDRDCKHARENHKPGFWEELNGSSQKTIEAKIAKIRQPIATIKERINGCHGWLARLNALTRPTPEIIKEFFPRYEIKKAPYPSEDDFLSLPKYRAFVRRDTANNVRRIRTHPEPPVVFGMREAILRRMSEQYQERLKARQQPQPSPASGNGRQPTDDDFSY